MLVELRSVVKGSGGLGCGDSGALGPRARLIGAVAVAGVIGAGLIEIADSGATSASALGLPPVTLPTVTLPPTTLPSVTLPSTTLATDPTTLPVTVPTLPDTTPTLPVTVPTLPVTVPTLPDTTPTLPVTVPTLPDTTPTLPVTVPTVPVTIPTLPITLPTLPITIPTLPITTPAPLVPTLSVTPSSAKRRAAVVAQGTNFVPDESVVVTYMSGLRKASKASTVLCRTTVSLTGTFSCKGALPRAARSGKRGKHNVVAAGSSGDRKTGTVNLVRRTKK